MDKITPEQRSYTMSRIRSKDTKPEMLVRRHRHALGFRYRLHYSKFPGHPDIVLPKWHTVIFVNGCFWHRHEGRKAASTPKSNVEFWNAKFERNVACDRKEHAALEAQGKVLALARKYCEMFHLEAVLVVTSPGDAIFVEGGP